VQFSLQSSPEFLRDKFHLEILTGSTGAGASNKGGVNTPSYFLDLHVIRSRLLLGPNQQ